MKILKLIQNDFGGYYAVLDEIEKMTYEKIGLDYIGSTLDSEGNVIQSHFLKKESYGNAFAGRELVLQMKDGSEHTIKDYWFDNGSYKNHGEFVSIGAKTIDELKKCYVYYGMNIKKTVFEKMVEEYLQTDRLYEYREVEHWINNR